MSRSDVVVIVKMIGGIIISSFVGYLISIASGCALAMAIGVVLGEQDAPGGQA